MESIFSIISRLSKRPFVTGAERIPCDLFDDAVSDSCGNLVLFRKGCGENRKTVLVEAHLDEIGLCVSAIHGGGFLEMVPCGGIDLSTLPGSEYTVFGKKTIHGIIATIPPHLKKIGESKKNTKQPIYLDTGILSKEALEACVKIGDPAVSSLLPRQFADGKIMGRSLDNKVGVAALLTAYRMLETTENDIYFLLSVGEETTSRGVRKFCREHKVDLAIVLDAGFAFRGGLRREQCIVCGEGPSVSFTDTLSVDASQWAVRVAKKAALPIQRIAEPGGTGTSATAIQVLGGGIPSLVISIPVFYMHTASEIVLEKDVLSCADLLVALLSDDEIPSKEVTIVGSI